MDDKRLAPPEAVAVIGLLGGVASGKSLVAGQLVELGAVVVDGDQAAHEVLKERQTEHAAGERWGDAIFGADGHIDRTALGNIVFAPPPAGPRELEFLEKLVHPRTGARLRQQMAEAAAEGAPALVLDAAVMLKAGWDKMCDTIWFVDAPRTVRAGRARQRGWTEEEFTAREAAQESLDEKRRLAQFVIDNSGPPEETAEQVREQWQRLMEPRE